MSDGAPAVQLQGWLPGEENNGLGTIGEHMRDEWKEAKRKGDDTAQATLTLVVALVKCRRFTEREAPDEDIVATQIVRIEVVRPGADYQTVRGVLDAIHDARLGNTTLPGMGNDDQDGDDTSTDD